MVKMTKVYPRWNDFASVVENKHAAAGFKDIVSNELEKDERVDNDNDLEVVLTVWKKSLLFNCDGFTVFDSHGNLVYRVDNYNKGGEDIFLMDACGNSVLTIRPKKRRLGESKAWMVYEGEKIDKPKYMVKKIANILTNSKTSSIAQVMKSTSTTSGSIKQAEWDTMMWIDGCFRRRSCSMYKDNEKRNKLSEIKPKSDGMVKGVTVGLDIFNLVVKPELVDMMPLAMAIVILLDQM